MINNHEDLYEINSLYHFHEIAGGKFISEFVIIEFLIPFIKKY